MRMVGDVGRGCSGCLVVLEVRFTMVFLVDMLDGFE